MTLNAVTLKAVFTFAKSVLKISTEALLPDAALRARVQAKAADKAVFAALFKLPRFTARQEFTGIVVGYTLASFFGNDFL